MHFLQPLLERRQEDPTEPVEPLGMLGQMLNQGQGMPPMQGIGAPFSMRQEEGAPMGGLAQLLQREGDVPNVPIQTGFNHTRPIERAPTTQAQRRNF